MVRHEETQAVGDQGRSGPKGPQAGSPGHWTSETNAADDPPGDEGSQAQKRYPGGRFALTWALRGALALILAGPLVAAGLEVWNGIELEVLNSKRWLVRARGEVRTNDAFRHMLSIRGVGDVRYSVAPKFSLVSQFHVIEGKARLGWDESNRLLGGFEVPFRGESRTFTARTVYERNWLPLNRTYDRFRERLSLRWTRVWLKPQLMAEVITDSHGRAATRPSFTVLVPVAKRVELDIGYHFEFRPGRLGGNRQMVYTYFRIRRQGR